MRLGFAMVLLAGLLGCSENRRPVDGPPAPDASLAGPAGHFVLVDAKGRVVAPYPGVFLVGDRGSLWSLDWETGALQSPPPLAFGEQYGAPRCAGPGYLSLQIPRMVFSLANDPRPRMRNDSERAVKRDIVSNRLEDGGCFDWPATMPLEVVPLASSVLVEPLPDPGFEGPLRVERR